MKIYDLFYIENPSQGTRLWFRSTDPQSTQWLLTELKQSFPSLRIIDEYKLLDVIYGYGVDTHLDSKFDGIKWWATRKLCHQGWEPFSYEYKDSPRIICFRREQIISPE